MTDEEQPATKPYAKLRFTHANGDSDVRMPDGEIVRLTPAELRQLERTHYVLAQGTRRTP